MTNLPEWSTVSAALLPAALMELWRRSPDDPLLWASAHRFFYGGPMEIAPALQDIYRDQHPFLVVQKPAQIGMTECCINVALHAAASNRGDRGHVGYFMPTQENADRLSQDRLAGAIRDSAPLRALFQRESGVERSAQRVQMRAVGAGLIYLTGSDQPSQYTGLDLDLVILDEFDVMKPEVLSHAQARLRSSRAPQLRVISTPTIPEYGVNALLLESDERHYELHCAGCGEWLEPRFPENVDFDRQLVICNCQVPLPHDLEGRWVARHPERNEIRGYQLSRLVLPRPPISMMKIAANGTTMSQEQFWRQDLGMPWVTANARLTQGDLLGACGPRPPIIDHDPSTVVVMGVDVGVKQFWVVVREFYGKKSYLKGARSIEGDWEDVAAYARKLGVAWCAVDALPDTRGAARLLSGLRDRLRAGFVCYYTRERDHIYDWGPPPTISAARTAILDELFDSVRQGVTTMPGNVLEVDQGRYAAHMQALVRVIEPDDFGQPVPSYKHTRPDDYAHAEAYALLVARLFGPHNGFWE